MKTPLLSVCLITYNHEKYIRQAIEGVLMQKVDFTWELIIAEDCSTDNTRAILLEYKDKYPDFIKLILQEKNVGPAKNFKDLLAIPKTEYIAYLEGDDYWVTNDKLQKQVDVLKSNKIGLVYTNLKHFNQNTEVFTNMALIHVNLQKEVVPLLLKNKFINFSTCVFRTSVLNKVLLNLEAELENAIIGDTRILLETAHNSEIYFLDEITTVYRILEGSASHPTNIDRYIVVLKDTYLCRKTFVERNRLNKKWLSDSICNTNRGLINQAFVTQKYSDTTKLLKNLLILDVFKYCSWTVFTNKITIDIYLKFVLSIIGIGSLRQKIKK
jgi:glycosyltransferase involved in cell wall biosynthesis